MQYSTLLTLVSSLALASAAPPIDGTPVPGTTGKLGDAQVVTGNPAGVTYTAVLPNSPSTGIRGYISGTTAPGGTGVTFNVNFYGFPSAALGPFLYHIHDQPVPADGNCTATLAHLDPYIRGEMPPCDPSQPATCQVGDLAGKHGNITTSPFTASYVDPYVSSASGVGSFFGNRSIVIHTSNTTRLTCASFVLSSNGTGNATNATVPSSPSPMPFTGGAANTVASAGAVLLAGMAAFALL